MSTKLELSYDPDLEVIKKIVYSKLNNTKYSTPKGFWCRENAIKAVRYAILDYFNYSKKDLNTNFTLRKLDTIGLRSVRKFGDVYDLVSNAVPEFNLYPWELKKLPDNFWNVDNTIEAIYWLVYEVLDTTPINSNLTPTLLIQNGLKRVYVKYDHSVKNILDVVFPEKYFGKF